MPLSLRFFKPDSDKPYPDRFFIIDQNISPTLATTNKKTIVLQKYDLGAGTDLDAFAKFILLKLGKKFQEHEEPTLRCYTHVYIGTDQKLKTNAVLHFTFDDIFCSQYYTQLRDYSEITLTKQLSHCRQTPLNKQEFETTTFSTGYSQTFQISIEVALLKTYKEKYIDDFIHQIQDNLIRHLTKKIDEPSSILKSRRI